MMRRDDSAQMMLLAAFVIVIGLITYSLLLNDVIFSRHFTSVEGDVAGRDVREFRALTFEQVEAAAASARSQNATGSDDMTEVFTNFMKNYTDAAIGVFAIKAASINITLNSVNITQNTTQQQQYVRATIVSHTYTNGSLIIPMDNQQNNILTVYRLIYDITDNYGVPVWEILQDPRGSSYTNWSVNITTTNESFSSNPSVSSIQNRIYAGGPFVIDAADLNDTIINRIQGIANNTINTIYVGSGSDAEFEFNTTMSNKNFTITFTMSDESNATLTIKFPGPNVTLLSFGGDADDLYIDAEDAEIDDKKLEDITLRNSGIGDITIDKIRVNWAPNSSEQIKKIKLNNTEVWSGTQNANTTLDITNHTLTTDITSGQITIHKLWQNFSYANNSMMRRPPRIAIYPPDGVHESSLNVMTGYYSDTGVPYTIIDDDVINASNSLSGEGLYAYDVLTLPHASLNGSDPMPFYTAYKLNEWVANGGVLHAQCKSIDEKTAYNGIGSLEAVIENADGTAHPQSGFMGVENPGKPEAGVNFTFEAASAYNPLAQAYTTDGSLQHIGETVENFVPVSGNLTPANITVLANTSDDNGIEYAYTSYGLGLVVYLAGHDQSKDTQRQRERLMYGTMFYSVVEEQTIPLVKDVDVTVRYKSGDTSYEGRFGI